MKTSEVLKLAKELISNPEKWCQDYFAFDTDGIETFGSDPGACRFCSLGAIQRVTGSPEFEPYSDALDRATILVAGDSERIAEFNDSHTHEEVMQVWDRAISIAEKEEEKEGAE